MHEEASKDNFLDLSKFVLNDIWGECFICGSGGLFK